MKASTSIGVLVLCLITSIPLGAHAQAEQLYGTWRLVSYNRQVTGSAEREDVFGKSPRGFITYGPDGRMSVLIVKENRSKPNDPTKPTDQERAELHKSVIAYGGTFKVDGSHVLHDVDISWNETWTGTPQPRNFRIEGRNLIISTNPAISPVDGKQNIAILTWEKVQ